MSCDCRWLAASVAKVEEAKYRRMAAAPPTLVFLDFHCTSAPNFKCFSKLSPS